MVRFSVVIGAALQVARRPGGRVGQLAEMSFALTTLLIVLWIVVTTATGRL